MNFDKCGIVPGFGRSGHILADNHTTSTSNFDSSSKMEQVDDNANEGTGTIVIAESSQDVRTH